MADRTATLSPCGRYRYALARSCGPLLAGGTCLFVMLNPSTADADIDDPTTRRCVGFATRWGFSRLEVVNLFAFRSTDPAGLALAADPIGPDNDAHLQVEAASASRIVCAWGAHGRHLQRGKYVRAMLQGRGHVLHHLGLTKSGEPRHPLYLPGTIEPEPWLESGPA